MEGHVTKGSLALALSIGFNALGGLVFWLVAARLESIDAVGEASAVFQSLLFVNFAANLGLPVVIGRFAAGTSPRSTTIVNAAMAVRAAAAIISGLLFLLLAWRSSVLDPLIEQRPVLGSILFVALGTGAGAAVLFEVRLISLRAWGLVVGRSAVVALSRLPLLILVPRVADDDTALVLFLAAAAPIAISGFVGVAWLRATVDRSDRLIGPWPTDSRRLARFAGVNWFGLLSTQGPVFAIPVVVAFSVSSADNAAFYVSWSFGAIVFLLPQMIGQVVLSEASLSRSWVRSLFQGLRLALALTMASAVAAQVFAGTIARVYGPDYAEVKQQLPLVVAAGIPWSYTSIGLAAARVREQHGEVLLISTVFVLATMVPTLIFTPIHGTNGAVWSWLGGTSLTAAVTASRYLRWRMEPDVVNEATSAQSLTRPVVGA